jgi:adenylate kinase family enzyme
MIKNIKKIYIIGPAGSGKSTLANIFSKKYNLPTLDLDDIFWRTKYTKEYSPAEKQNQLKNFLKKYKKVGWIIEGAPKEFIKPVSKYTPRVIWLNPNIIVLIYRITKRFAIERLHYLLSFFNPEINKKYFFRHNHVIVKSSWRSYYRLLKGLLSYKLKNDLYLQHKNIALFISKQRTTSI